MFYKMKIAIICAICEKPKKESETYEVKLIDYRLNNATQLEARPGRSLIIQQSVVVRVCRTCAKRMGYKVKAPVKKTTAIFDHASPGK